jgi:formylglycine-generating enzyme required for sulfatase activity
MAADEKKPEALPDDLALKEGRYVSLKDGAPMVWIPGGAFYMGQAEDEIFAKPHEKPGRTVYLEGYFIDIHPVTNRQYALFKQDGGYKDQSLWCPEGWDWIREKKIEIPVSWENEAFKGEEQPVAGVSWYEADAYARWAGKALPTEAEWEKAARGVDGRRFPWGDEFPTIDRVNFDSYKGCTTPVDAYPAGSSPYGCLDMAGNVNNWCKDWYWEDFYAWCVEKNVNRAPVLDDELFDRLKLPKRLKSDRGGGYATAFQFLEILSCTDKVCWPPEARNLWNGFRCVKPAKAIR